jgi:hypothetical protein
VNNVEKTENKISGLIGEKNNRNIRKYSVEYHRIFRACSTDGREEKFRGKFWWHILDGIY